MALGNWNTLVNSTVTTANTANTTIWYTQGGNIAFNVSSTPSYSFGFTGFNTPAAVEERDTFLDWVNETRRVAALEESIQGS